MNQSPVGKLVPAQGAWRTYSLAEGLCDIQVEHIAEDHEGYLWFATWNGGVSRFDGDEFRTFTRTSGLCGNQVMAVLLDSQDRLWFGTRDGGACWYDGRHFHSFPDINSANNTITYITEDREGRIWFAGDGALGYCAGETYHNLYPESLRALTTPPSAETFGSCNGIVEDAAGHIWFACNTLLRYDGQAFHSYGPADGLPPTDFAYTAALDSHDDLWVGGMRTVGRFADGIYHAESLNIGSYIRKMQTDSDNRLWICTSGSGAHYLDNGEFKPLTVQDGLAYDVVNSAFEDREGHIWFATWGGGVSRWSPHSMQVIGCENGKALEESFTFLQDRHNHLWIGFASIFSPLVESIAHYDGEQLRGIQAVTDLGNCWAICEDHHGNMYFGGDRGIIRFDGQHFEVVGPEQGFDGKAVHSLAINRQNNLLIGYSAPAEQTVQIARYDGDQCTSLFADEDTDNQDCIAALVITHQDNLWFARCGTKDKDRGKGIACLRQGAGLATFTTADGLVDDRVEDLLEDRDGNLWIATLGGLSCFDGIAFRHFTTENGLPNNRIRCLCEDRQGHLWLGTDSGVVRYDGEQFQTIRSSHLYSVTSIVEDHSGHFWFAALNHVLRYTPSTTPPKIRILRVLADQVYEGDTEVELTVDTHQIIIEYKGMSFRSHPREMLYSHRLRGYKDEWQAADNAEMRAYYQELPPGDYTFEVRAIDHDFNRSEPATLRLKINPDPRYELMTGDAAQAAQAFVGHSTALHQILSQVREVADTDLTVLVLGETGTGKGLLARTLHRLSKRSERPLIQVNCGALPTGLIESELFGHEKGAFTSAATRKLGKVELAQGGTLFLDEVGDLALEAQVKLLRMLEERNFERVGGSETFYADVRVIAATNRNLQQMVSTGSFREDLYFRLQVFPLQLPPLRKRREDIPQLAMHFMKHMAAHLDKEVTNLSPEAVVALQAYYWPGNVRELEHSIQRAVIICKGTSILASDIALQLPTAEQPHSRHLLTLEENERLHILTVLEESGWVIKGRNGAAEILGLPSSTLRSRMKKLNIQRPTG